MRSSVNEDENEERESDEKMRIETVGRRKGKPDPFEGTKERIKGPFEDAGHYGVSHGSRSRIRHSSARAHCCRAYRCRSERGE